MLVKRYLNLRPVYCVDQRGQIALSGHQQWLLNRHSLIRQSRKGCPGFIDLKCDHIKTICMNTPAVIGSYPYIKVYIKDLRFPGYPLSTRSR